MSEIKQFTDLEQSKKLAEFLSLESADMYYSKHNTLHANTLYGSCDIQYFNIHEYIPCWSLASLLALLPRVSLNQTKENEWYCVAEPNRLYFGAHCNNPVDACYNLIMKLHELKLL